MSRPAARATMQALGALAISLTCIALAIAL